MFFFFQAEDGIRDRNVTGVQTCALPISLSLSLCLASARRPYRLSVMTHERTIDFCKFRTMHNEYSGQGESTRQVISFTFKVSKKIGRASCRERGGKSRGSSARKE